VWSVFSVIAHYVVVVCVCGHTIWGVATMVNAQDQADGRRAMTKTHSPMTFNGYGRYPGQC